MLTLNFKGLIFDLDGTLVRSPLDFAAIRRDLGMVEGETIIEHIDAQPDDFIRQQKWQIVEGHELVAAKKAEPVPGVIKFLEGIKQRGIKAAVLTRNFSQAANQSLAQLGFDFDPVLTRESCKPKPDPAGIRLILEAWRFSKEEVAMIGDYLFDVQTGRNAGIKTYLYCARSRPEFAAQADHVFADYSELTLSN